MNSMSNSPVTSPATEAPIMDAADNLKALAESIIERKQHILNALEYSNGTHTLDDIVYMILQNRLIWWPLDNGFMLTEVIEYPRTKHFNVFLAGGDLEEIMATQDNLVRAAKLCKCSALTLGGRRGWTKALKAQGWKEAHTGAYLDIEEDGEDG